MSIEEKSKLFAKINKLKSEGKLDEANALRENIPLSPYIAKAIKEVFGADELVKSGANLKDVEEVYGKDWQEK